MGQKLHSFIDVCSCFFFFVFFFFCRCYYYVCVCVFIVNNSLSLKEERRVQKMIRLGRKKRRSRVKEDSKKWTSVVVLFSRSLNFSIFYFIDIITENFAAFFFSISFCFISLSFFICPKTNVCSVVVIVVNGM